MWHSHPGADSPQGVGLSQWSIALVAEMDFFHRYDNRSRRCGVATLEHESTGRKLVMIIGLQQDWQTSVSSDLEFVMDLLVEDEDDIDSTLPAEFRNKIWLRYQQSPTVHGSLRKFQYFQCTRSFGTELIHLTMDETRKVQFHLQISPYRTEQELAAFLESLLRGLLTLVDSERVERLLSYLDSHLARRKHDMEEHRNLICASDGCEMTAAETSAAELWRTYIDQGVVSRGSGALHQKLVLSIAAYWLEARRLASKRVEPDLEMPQGDMSAAGNVICSELLPVDKPGPQNLLHKVQAWMTGTFDYLA
ncbi:hypothetical protein A0H81_02102 [Grifola frondosa]|uniref:Uncharacterized protein n=1 Tax=Grifola frondosa TaxID=5627 RepID=A0A1C7MK32_GRIFR|nr:hypothetical protein A0H81_02102 [Grifola frondosa]